MSCKYKSSGNPRFCEVINGECQFLKPPYDDECPILAAYPDWDKYQAECKTKTTENRTTDFNFV